MTTTMKCILPQNQRQTKFRVDNLCKKIKNWLMLSAAVKLYCFPLIMTGALAQSTHVPSSMPSLLPSNTPTFNSYLDYTFDVATNEITIEYHFDPSLTYRYIAVYDANVIQDVSQSYVNSYSFWRSSKFMHQILNK